MENLYNETMFTLNKYGLNANKKLGQNFLIDEFIVNNICDIADVKKSDLVLEIGPGIGTLTASLLERAGKVISIELDDKMVNVLNDRFKFYDNFKLIHEDVLNVDLNSLIKEELNDTLKACKVVANLPYYITTPILIKLLEEKINIKSITIMVQKEVAQRLTAKPGTKNASSISYLIDFYTDSKIAFNVNKNAFYPKPKVDSSVINMKILEKPKLKIDNEKKFFNMIKACFTQKRKTLLNSLVNNKIFPTKKDVEDVLKKLNLDPNLRCENLSLEDFFNIYKNL